MLILDYLRERNQASPAVARRALDLVDRGYQRLLGFECLDSRQNRKQGYEWFGGAAPPHEALTAYGLLEFRDMTRVYDGVDRGMLERTRQWLLSRRDGKGGFLRRKDFHGFGSASDEICNAYIVWALTESGKDDDLTLELTTLNERAKTSKDPYFVALVANSLLNRDQKEEGGTLLRALAAAQKLPAGQLEGAERSITHSGGRDLQIETTALAVLAWLKRPNKADYRDNLKAALRWLSQQRGGFGSFGSTQATILTLKALATANRTAKALAPGEVALFIDDQRVAGQKVPAGFQDVLVLDVPNPDQQLRTGKNILRLEFTSETEVPYTLSWSYHTLKPPSAETCPVRLTTRLDRAMASEGDTIRLTAVLENRSADGQGMTLAIIGLPAGLSLPEDLRQLKDHARLRNDGAEPGLIGFWEIQGRELILYWRSLTPNQKIEVHLDVYCRIPGEYRGPASRAYLYYGADHKCWVDPLTIGIQAR